MDGFAVRDTIAPDHGGFAPLVDSPHRRRPGLAGLAPGSLVVVRDEEWLVTQVARTRDGTLATVHGLSELVAGTTAQFSEALDTITPFDPRDTKVVADGSRNHQLARLWLEATLRKTALPIDDQHLAVSNAMLLDPLDYQRSAVRKALDPDTLRPRILLADAVGLGKTLEIGMILAELVRRGRGERILVVTPRHVLEQMQHELWCRFALPFVRLDSVGIQRVRRRLPATRNPFSLYKRAIISIDTLKNDRYLAHLRKHRWDAVVIDESHNITNSSTQNNRLANVLAPQTDALILASATPHNGKKESFAELVRLLEPTAVTPDGEWTPTNCRAWWYDDNAELRRVIEAGDLGAWRVFLHPEQRAYVEGDRQGTFRLSGGAGTGKTVVAIHRARHLAKQNPGARILLTTFTRNLADDLASGVRRLDDAIEVRTRLDIPGIYAKGIDQVAWAVVQRAGDGIGNAVEAVLGVSRTAVLKASPDTLWQEVIEDAGEDLPPALATQAFLEAEYTQVVLPQRITLPTAYARSRRTGRGVALDRAKRVAVWKVIDAYRAQARMLESTDYYEKAAIAAAWLDHSGTRLFDHVIVDEAQDLAPSRLQLLRALVAEGPNDLFLCEDSHQRIYGQKVVLSHCGINVRGGRSRRLTLNYRTTAQNLGWAMRMLSGADWTDLEGEGEEHTYHSARSGPPPLLAPTASLGKELMEASRIIRSWLPEDRTVEDNRAAGRATAPEDIAVLVRDKYRRENVVNGLAKLGVEVRSVDREAVRPGKPLVMTMHRGKGLEFTHVLLFGVAEGAIPRSLKDYESSEQDKADALLRERALLYVAATRARDVLAVTWNGKRSQLLEPQLG